MVTNLNWIKGLDNDQRVAHDISLLSRSAYKLSNYALAIELQEWAAAEYKACRSIYRHLFQQSVEINHG